MNIWGKREADPILDQISLIPLEEETSRTDAFHASQFLAAEESLTYALAYDSQLDEIKRKAEENNEDLIDPNELNQRYAGRVERPFDSPMRISVAEEIAQRADSRRLLREKIARGPQDYLQKGLINFAAGSLSHIADPIEFGAGLATGGLANAALKATRIGKALGYGVRKLTHAQSGMRIAAEGVIGNAAIEPFIYNAKQEELADYTMEDALFGIAMGSVGFGAGRYLGGRAIDLGKSFGSKWVDSAHTTNVGRMAQDKVTDNIHTKDVVAEINTRGFDESVGKPQYEFVHRESSELGGSSLFASKSGDSDLEFKSFDEGYAGESSVTLTSNINEANARSASKFDDVVGAVEEYRISEDARLFDLEKNFDEAIVSKIKDIVGDDVDFSKSAIEVLDDIKGDIAIGEKPPEILDQIQEAMAESGYDGYHHRKGLLYGEQKNPSDVVSIFNPDKVEKIGEYKADGKFTKGLSREDVITKKNEYNSKESDIHYDRNAEIEYAKKQAEPDDIEKSANLESIEAKEKEIDLDLSLMKKSDTLSKGLKESISVIEKESNEAVRKSNLIDAAFKCLRGG
jgi:hypothetical protein